MRRRAGDPSVARAGRRALPLDLDGDRTPGRVAPGSDVPEDRQVLRPWTPAPMSATSAVAASRRRREQPDRDAGDRGGPLGRDRPAVEDGDRARPSPGR